jgi:hypothetical protein
MRLRACEEGRGALQHPPLSLSHLARGDQQDPLQRLQTLSAPLHRSSLLTIGIPIIPRPMNPILLSAGSATWIELALQARAVLRAKLFVKPRAHEWRSVLKAVAGSTLRGPAPPAAGMSSITTDTCPMPDRTKCIFTEALRQATRLWG